MAVKLPEASVVISRLSPLPMLIIETRAPLIVAPVVSVTRPVIVPEVFCAYRSSLNIIMTMVRNHSLLRWIIGLPLSVDQSSFAEKNSKFASSSGHAIEGLESCQGSCTSVISIQLCRNLDCFKTRNEDAERPHNFI